MSILAGLIIRLYSCLLKYAKQDSSLLGKKEIKRDKAKNVSIEDSTLERWKTLIWKCFTIFSHPCKRNELTNYI